MIKEIRVINLRAFEDSGIVRLDLISPILGKNDVGKSTILYGLKWFFEPPKRGGIPIKEIFGHNEDASVIIEVAFEPSRLITQEIKIDAKNPTNLSQENLLDDKGLLRLRLNLTSKASGPLEAYINDLDDEELFGLALLKQDGLISLLNKRGLPAVASGKETNVQKRDSLRKKEISNGLKMRTGWIDVSEYEKAFRSILPQWSFFGDEASYGVGETNVQNQFKGVVEQVVSQMSVAVEIDDKVRASVQEEFEKVFSHLVRMTDAVKGIDAVTDVDWKKAVSNINLNWIDTFGMKVLYEMRGAGVRRLFMVAYLQYLALKDTSEGEGNQYIFGIEEPELHLHPGAQRELIEAFSELNEARHQIIFTSHSPVFATTSVIESLILVERGQKAAKISQHPQLNLEHVANELGVEVSDRLIGKDHVILVEGIGDERFYEEALSQLYNAGYTKLVPSTVLFLQCGGNGNLKYSVMSRKMDEAGLCWAVIVDSDRANAGDSPSKIALDIYNNHPDTCKLVHIIKKTCIENYLDSGAIKNVTGIDVNIPHCGKLCDSSSGNKITKNKRKIITDNMKAIVENMGAKVLSSSSMPTGKVEVKDCEMVEIFEGIKTSFSL